MNSTTLWHVVNMSFACKPLVRRLKPSVLISWAMVWPLCVCFLRTITSRGLVMKPAIIPEMTEDRIT